MDTHGPTDTSDTTPVDLLIRHAHIITMDDAGTRIPDGAVAIAGNRISHVGPDADVATKIVAARTIDARGGPLHPGLVETHLHASFQSIRGVHLEDTIEDDILDAFYLPWFDVVTSEEEGSACLLASLEMIRNGTTCFMEAGTVLDTEAAASAARTVGIRAVLGDPFIWDRPASVVQGKASLETARRTERPRVQRAPQDLEDALAVLGGELRRNEDPEALVTGHIAVNGLGTASEALLVEAKRVARAAGVTLDMHHAYSPADTAADRDRYGRDPLIHLAELGILDSHTTLAHANHLTDVEADLVVETGVNLAWAPAASMLWGHGGTLHGRHAEIWRRGGNIGLGSDSANWSNDFDLFKQAMLALLTARDVHQDRTYLVADDVLRMATRGGARAVGLEDRIGSIEVGKKADLVLHTLDRPELRPVTDMVRNLVHAARSKSVRTVVVDGRVVLDDGVFPHLDEPALLARIDERAQAMLRRMGQQALPDPMPGRR
ncbi:MAG: amidohydrolase family protein [Chloroflexi bacterium]|nr:amidohydrolase family protein [Chloroflexota bacterium]